jgi:hypothetical protein
MKLKNLFSILFAFLLTACSFSTLNSPTSVSTGNLPDLIVGSIKVSMVDATADV